MSSWPIGSIIHSIIRVARREQSSGPPVCLSIGQSSRYPVRPSEVIRFRGGDVDRRQLAALFPRVIISVTKRDWTHENSTEQVYWQISRRDHTVPKYFFSAHGKSFCPLATLVSHGTHVQQLQSFTWCQIELRCSGGRERGSSSSYSQVGRSVWYKSEAGRNITAKTVPPENVARVESSGHNS